jgi:hypothetical protein
VYSLSQRVRNPSVEKHSLVEQENWTFHNWKGKSDSPLLQGKVFNWKSVQLAERFKQHMLETLI